MPGVFVALPFRAEDSAMSILGWILFGFGVGLIARAVMPGRDPIGLIGTTVLGIIGALFGGWVGHALGLYQTDESAGFIGATIGAFLVLGVYNWAMRRRLQRSSAVSRARSGGDDDHRRAA